jgi:hypothetical protein
LELLVSLVVLVVLIAGGLFLFTRLRGSTTMNRAARVIGSRLDDVPKSNHRQPTVETLQPGDAIAFGDGGNGLVISVLECSERVGPRSSSWRWSFLDDQKMLEAASDGNILYDRSEVIYQGTELFNRLIAEAGQGGILKLFEQRVRAGTNASNPLKFEYAGLTFHIRSTGTFGAKALGKPLGEVWRDVSPEPDQNVYFGAEAPSGEQLLGIWTSHILLLVGRPLGITDVDAIYPGTEGAA